MSNDRADRADYDSLIHTSNTASGYTFTKTCGNPKCKRQFQTNEPKRQYCHIRCRDYAAQLRRRNRDSLEVGDFSPSGRERAEQRRTQLLEEAREALTTRDKRREAEILADAVRKGRLTIETCPDPEVRRLAEHLLLTGGTDPAPEASPQDQGEDLLRNLGFLPPTKDKS